MFEQQVLGQIPIWAFFLLMLLITLVPIEVGVRIGQRRRLSRNHENEGAVGHVVGATLALLGFVLALTLGSATARFDARKEALIDNVNAVESAYRNAALLPEPQNSESRRLLREFVEARLGMDEKYSNSAELAKVDSRVRSIEAAIWTQAEQLAQINSSSEINALYTDSLNEVFKGHNKRVVLGAVFRIPFGLWMGLLLGTLLSTFGVGYHFGLSGTRSPIGTVLLSVIFTLVMTLIFDIDEPGKGFIGVNQAPIRQLYERMHSPE